MESGIGVRVREARERRGLTKAELARGAQLSPGAVSRIEHGEREPGGATVARLAAVLGVDPGHLLTGDGRVGQSHDHHIRSVAPQPTPEPGMDPLVVGAITLVAQVMPTLPPAGRARVARIIEAALGAGVVVAALTPG